MRSKTAARATLTAAAAILLCGACDSGAQAAWQYTQTAANPISFTYRTNGPASGTTATGTLPTSGAAFSGSFATDHSLDVTLAAPSGYQFLVTHIPGSTNGTVAFDFWSNNTLNGPFVNMTLTGTDFVGLSGAITDTSYGQVAFGNNQFAVNLNINYTTDSPFNPSLPTSTCPRTSPAATRESAAPTRLSSARRPNRFRVPGPGNQLAETRPRARTHDRECPRPCAIALLRRRQRRTAEAVA